MSKVPEITVVASLTVSNDEQSLVVKSFDLAWQTAKTLKRPVHVSFDGFVRKDA